MQTSENTLESGKECVICYESLSATKNICITECGHEFCFSCMMKHVQRNTGCPICRSTIIEDIDSDSEEEEEDEDEYSEVSWSDSDDSVIGDSENEYPIEQLEEAFMAKGYRLKDALSLLMYKFSKTDEKYTKGYIKKLEEDIDEMNEELQWECEERSNMEKEDTRKPELDDEIPSND